MARIFGDEVVVNLDDVHINHNTHELIVGSGDGGLHHVATHQGMVPAVEKAVGEKHDRREKEENKVHREDVREA
jgi:hypothetical protein